MKYEYAIQQKWKGAKRWNTTDPHYASIRKAKLYLMCHNENANRYKSRIIKRAVGKWEVVE